MSKIVPMGSRILVTDLNPVTELEERARASGIHVVLTEQSIPKPTTGLVVAIGPDPLLQEQIKVGDTVVFAKYAGTSIQVEGTTYRSLEFQEIITVIREEPKL